MSEAKAAPKEASTAAKSGSKPEAKPATTPASTDTPKSEPAAEAKPSAASAPSAPAREVSYFSSVSTREYREGWAAIFGKPGNGSAEKPASDGPAAGGKNGTSKREKPRSVSLFLELDDLDKDTRKLVEKALKGEARKAGLKVKNLVSIRAEFQAS